MPGTSALLPTADRDVVGAALQETLVDLLHLAATAKQAHWNLYGPRFRSVHLQLDEIVETARTFADTVAERAATIGVAPDGRPAATAKAGSSADVPAGPLSDTVVVATFTTAVADLSVRMRRRIADTDGLDAVSQDLLIETTAALEKHHWMLRAENTP
ncbi:Dps family protein [Yinghuangia soli]|uniref:DNA starvation/stationary phase protection protein n=1 Tax=Yinghuangia soli TaxID=2908204 RepID=A0AA41Q5J5_9ACTN|nr:DNA starvation/stationary phase protection protein [Yinghuangia soli]MCF2531036.1 DNA starvation/stationary phase protection protein [Yinghuangia soli]